ncbi:hypothetical protein BP00DRAFT_367348, partial [Aspergillus indologenus CBS 114.80]
MVYRGKPSASCERCRSRRMRCDHGSPSCTQCLRAKVQCPGYRDPLDLGFRDQNEEVIRRSQRSIPKRKLVTSRTTIEAVGPNVHRDSMVPSPQNTPDYPAHELARGYLFCHYMAGGPRGGHLSYLRPLVQSPQSLAVNAALDAVGMAALANIRMSPRMMLQARREYTTALSQTNRALKDPLMSRRDDILAAVVLLGMFEVMACTDDSFIDRWMKHMDGGARLIEFRGPDQLTRTEGLGIFTQLRAQISTSNLYQEKYNSTIVADLTEKAKHYRDENDHVLDDLGLLVIRLSNFCAASKDGTITDPSEIIRTALKLDAELIALFIDVPFPWDYRTVKVVDGEPIARLVLGPNYHVYHSLAASSMWNNYRSARILIHELIIDTVNGLDSSEHDAARYQQRENLVDQSRQIVRQLVEDICASAPFHFGAGDTDDETPAVSRSEPTSLNTLTTHSVAPFDLTGAGGLTLVWPLLIAANSGTASFEQRQWITGCFDKIGHSMRINQALAMAQLLRKGMNTRAWLTPEFGSP